MAPPDWQAVQWDGGCGDGLFITILFHHKRFHISILPPSSPITIERQLLSKFDTINDDDQDEVLTVQKEIEDFVYEAGGSMWTQLAPLSPNNTELSDLHSLLYPETFSFYFVTKNGKAALVQYETDKVQYDAFGMKIVNDINLPQYSSKDIRVLETLVGQGYITQVSVKGVEMCCKSGDDNFWQSIEREFDCLSKVARSKYGNKIRVPKLLGLVVSVDNGTIIGILEEFIPVGEPADLSELDDGGIEASIERRKKWGTQVQETVNLLHEIGVIWGDGKPHNVLIHGKTDDAWVVDFGGGYTEGWVDEELVESLRGDEQAVGRVQKFLESC